MLSFFFKVGSYCLNHHETKFSLSVMLTNMSSFFGFMNFLYIIFIPWNTSTLLLSFELILRGYFIWKFLRNNDPNYLPVWTLQGQSKDNWVSFGVGIPAPQHRHSGAFPVQLQCTLQTWNGLQIGEAALVSSLLLAFVAQSSSKWLWH